MAASGGKQPTFHTARAQRTVRPLSRAKHTWHTAVAPHRIQYTLQGCNQPQSDTVEGKCSLVIFFMSAADICWPRAVHYWRQPRSTELLSHYFAKHGDGAHVIHCSLVLEVFNGLQNRTDPTHFTNIYHHRLIEQQCNSSATVRDSLGN